VPLKVGVAMELALEAIITPYAKCGPNIGKSRPTVSYDCCCRRK
jgi:hypothetical protein